jgi:hypothetical protein
VIAFSTPNVELKDLLPKGGSLLYLLHIYKNAYMQKCIYAKMYILAYGYSGLALRSGHKDI